MTKFKTSILIQILSFVFITLVISHFIHGLAFADQENIKTTTKIRHRPIKYFIPEHRIKITAKVKDKDGVNLVRCYFKAEGQANFVFVSMNKTSGVKYDGILPAPSKYTNSIEYLLLVVNRKNVVVRSQPFTVNKEDKDKTPKWQDVSLEGDIKVSTELAKTTEPPKGFSDNITMDIVESSERFGSKTGIYAFLPSGAGGGATGAAASVLQGGTVIASTSVITATTAVIGGLAAAGAVGGGVSASSDDSSDDDRFSFQPPPPTCIDPRPVSGGFSEEPDVRQFDLGQPFGTFEFKYNTFVCPVRITVEQDSGTIWSTEDDPDFPPEFNGCISTNGEKMVNVRLQGRGSTMIQVTVDTGCINEEFPEPQVTTEWSYDAGCPEISVGSQINRRRFGR